MNSLIKLANKLVALGIVEGPNNYAAYSLSVVPEELRNWMPAGQLVYDARVMAAMLEAVRNIDAEAWCRLMRQLMDEYHAKDIKLAITATCVKLLEEL